MRSLPSSRNSLLDRQHAPSHEVLVQQRSLGSTSLALKPGLSGLGKGTRSFDAGSFDYLHLKLPLPKDLSSSGIFHANGNRVPKAYYLMRRSSDGFVSLSGMFKAAFPYATEDELRVEHEHLSAQTDATLEEQAGNVWGSPEFALKLADDYGISHWIDALLDPRTPHTSDPHIAAPPRFEIIPPKPIANSSMSTRKRTTSRDLRSASPVKQNASIANRPKATPRKRRAKKSAAPEATPSVADSAAESENDVDGLTKDEKDAIVEEADEKAAEVAADVAETAAAIVQAEEEANADAAEVNGEEPLLENTVRVSVTEDVVPGENDTETTRTTVRVELPTDAPDLELPTDTEGVVAIAKDIIDGAKELEESKTDHSAATTSKKGLKRKAEELDEDEIEGPEEIIHEVAEGEANELASGEVEMHGRPAKRTRIMVPAEDYRREKVKRRALTGLVGALAVGAMIPVFQTFF